MVTWCLSQMFDNFWMHHCGSLTIINVLQYISRVCINHAPATPARVRTTHRYWPQAEDASSNEGHICRQEPISMQSGDAGGGGVEADPPDTNFKSPVWGLTPLPDKSNAGRHYGAEQAIRCPACEKQYWPIHARVPVITAAVRGLWLLWSAAGVLSSVCSVD